MRYGIFSDVHGNLEAFKAACDYLDKERIDEFIFNGDIIGYGANPRECLELLGKIDPIIVAGNHDWATIDKFSLANFNPQAKDALLWTKEELREENLSFLNSFRLKYTGDDFICVHGSLNDPAKFNYIIYSYEASLNFSLFNKRILFVGHSHRAEAFSIKDEKISYIKSKEIKIDSKTKYIINVGSIGQPRDQDPRLSLCIYDSNEGLVKFVRLEYNIKKAADKILKKGLPPLLAMRLFEGW